MYFFQRNAIRFCEFIVHQQTDVIDEIYRHDTHIQFVDQLQ